MPSLSPSRSPRRFAARRVLPLVALGAGLFLGTACRKAQPPPEKAPAATTRAGAKTYGGVLAEAKPVALAEVLANPDAFTEKTVTIDGEVRKACTRKGCWMELAESQDAKQPGCRVTFKDYGFFVPTDSAGAHARVQGVVEVSELPAATVRHLEEEGAVFNKNPDGTAREVRIVATGVELWRDPA